MPQLLFTIFSFVILTLPALTLAYNPLLNEVTVPYEVKTISEINVQTEHLGELKGEPHMYEFAVGEATNLKMALMQLDSDTIVPLSLIVVRQNEDRGGVSEVGRLNGSNTDWQVVEDSVLGLAFNKSEVFVAELKTGIYRVEVSTPENYGKYVLVIGDQSVNKGYLATLSDIYTFQTFFNGSTFSMLGSSYVYYPIGITITILAFYFTWRQRNKIKGISHA
ncbi:MAG: hypothetical protein KBC78_00610 [Candidatus Pacebacteria bacterium]|nr:hypothetical protein [Candidatus Paceibacterota bacterium]